MARVAVSVVSAVVAAMAVSSLAASLSKERPCPDGKFYDHVTELCEPCIEICRNANLTGLVEKCRRLCPSTYAQLSNSQKQPQHLALSMDDPNDPSPSSTTTPFLALIGGVVAGIVLVSFLIIVGAFVCKRVQDNAEQNSGGGGSQQGSAERGGLNRSRQGYAPAGVQEENGEQAESERASQAKGLRGYCDPRHWFAPEVPAEETETGRQGTQEIALLGNSQGSVGQELAQPPKTVLATPIYKPSGAMRSTVTRI